MFASPIRISRLTANVRVDAAANQTQLCTKSPNPTHGSGWMVSDPANRGERNTSIYYSSLSPAPQPRRKLNNTSSFTPWRPVRLRCC